MKKLMSQNSRYRIYKADLGQLYDVAKFVVSENYKHHNEKMLDNMVEDIQSVYNEELSYFPKSYIYVVEDFRGEMIGCIRVMKWDKKDELPIQRIFNINPLQCIKKGGDMTFWHIGRFAINSLANASGISLFKQLMIFAIVPICKSLNGYMIAECDSKLLKIMNRLGIDTRRLGEGISYLGSETIPVYADRKGLLRFYSNFKHLYYDTNLSVSSN
ncbi:hypothetical protein [Parabacteroides distasonis]|nr:hypothetical protein [Parabacteroides distasonis]